MGATGATGPTGPTGPTGATGATGAAATQTALSAVNTNGSTLDIETEGTTVPLSDTKNSMGRNFADKEIIIPETGSYLVFYSIYTDKAVLASAAVFVDGAADERTLISPALPTSAFMNTSILPLEAGSVLELTLFDTNETVTLSKGVGANLTVVRIA